MSAFNKTSMMTAIEKANGGKPIQEIVREALNKHGTIEGAAKELGIASRTLRLLWMPAMGIEMKTMAVQVTH